MDLNFRNYPASVDLIMTILIDWREIYRVLVDMLGPWHRQFFLRSCNYSYLTMIKAVVDNI